MYQWFVLHDCLKKDLIVIQCLYSWLRVHMTKNMSLQTAKYRFSSLEPFLFTERSFRIIWSNSFIIKSITKSYLFFKRGITYIVTFSEVGGNDEEEGGGLDLADEINVVIKR